LIVIIDPQSECEEKRCIKSWEWTLAAFPSAQLRVVKPACTNQYACYPGLQVVLVTETAMPCVLTCLAKCNVFVQIEDANPTRPMFKCYVCETKKETRKKNPPQNHTEVMRPNIKTHASVQNPIQCTARVVRDVVPAQCKPRRNHASKDASIAPKKTARNMNTIRV
jgi:hypothetical protein